MVGATMLAVTSAGMASPSASRNLAGILDYIE